ncbi:MAG: glycosyltransferase family 4 protein, partial [bacterium]
MHVIMHCPGMPFHGGTIGEGESLGGAESAAYYLARELAGLGHQVTLFTSISPELAGSWDGVRYLSAGKPMPEAPLGAAFEWYAATTPHDLTIVQRVPFAFQRPHAGKVNFWWTHDLALKRHLPALARQLWNVDRLLAVSQFHREQIAGTYGTPDRRIAVVPNGIDPALFAGTEPGAEGDAARAERKWQGGRMIYSSRPERGLAFLVAEDGVMERLWAADRELTLLVAGYDNTAPHMRPLYEELWARCRGLPNVELIGPQSKKELADLMGSAFLHAYPTLFEEVSCITAMEAQAAGNPIVTSRLAALPETLADGGVAWVEPDPERLVERTCEEILRLRKDRAAWEALHGKALRKAAAYRWRPSAEHVIALAEEVLRERCASPRRLARHLIRNSDIVACEALAARFAGDAKALDSWVHGEIKDHYAFVQDGSYAEHYETIARWQADEGIDHGLD